MNGVREWEKTSIPTTDPHLGTVADGGVKRGAGIDAIQSFDFRRLFRTGRRLQASIARNVLRVPIALEVGFHFNISIYG